MNETVMDKDNVFETCSTWFQSERFLDKGCCSYLRRRQFKFQRSSKFRYMEFKMAVLSILLELRFVNGVFGEDVMYPCVSGSGAKNHERLGFKVTSQVGRSNRITNFNDKIVTFDASADKIAEKTVASIYRKENSLGFTFPRGEK